MSVRVMSTVFEESESTGNDRLVLLAIADEADDDGTNAYPGTKRLAMKVRLPERTVRRCIDRLVDSGELDRRLPERQGRGQLTHYTVLIGKGDTLTSFDGQEGGQKEAEGGQKVDTTLPLTSDDAEYPVPSTQYPKKRPPSQAQASLSDGFEEFWKTYPNKKERQNALKAWKARRREGIPAGKLIQAGANYTRKCKLQKTETRFIKHGATFLGPSEVWKDYLDDGAAMADVQYLRAVGDTIYDETPVVYS